MSVERRSGSAAAPGAVLAGVAGIVLGVAALIVSARISVVVPGSPVPQSMQTLAVVLVGVYLGPVRSGVAVAAYLAMGGLGVPVFADGASGVDRLVGPTAGYLAGFLVGAPLMAWWVRRPRLATRLGVLSGALAVHVVILTLGWMRLSALIGVTEAFRDGVRPFLVGALVKSVVALGAWIWVPQRPDPVTDL